VCRRLMTIPGVGPLVALTYRATVDVPTRFRNSKEGGKDRHRAMAKALQHDPTALGAQLQGTSAAGIRSLGSPSR
jgi:transposase